MRPIRAFGGTPVATGICDVEASREEGVGCARFRRPGREPVAQSVSAEYHGWYDIPVQTAEASDNPGLGEENARCRCAHISLCMADLPGCQPLFTPLPT
jgi:hypothetical protein